MTIICAFSDTHTLHRKVELPPADILVFAGDFLTKGFEITALLDFCQWLRSQPHKHKIMIAGNHDRILDRDAATFEHEITRHGIHYLRDSGIEVEGLKFWGSPYTPYFCNWAFNSERAELPLHWQKIPEGIDVLITHGPPRGTLDGWPTWEMRDGVLSRTIMQLGDEALRDRVAEIRPRLHIFGHIHSGHGIDGTSHNVAICDEQYNPTNKPHIIEL